MDPCYPSGLQNVCCLQKRKVGKRCGDVKKVSSRDLKGSQCTMAAKIEHNENILLKWSCKAEKYMFSCYVLQPCERQTTLVCEWVHS